MAKKEGLKRYEIPYFEGVNTLVGANISKKTELKHIENARSKVIGTIEKREGTRRLGDDITAVANYGLFWFENSGTPGMYRVSKVGATTSIFYLKSDGVWTIFAGTGSSLTTIEVDATFALGKCFIVQGNSIAPISIDSDGTTGRAGSSTPGGLVGAPAGAVLVNHYKNRLYMGDIDVGSNRVKNLIQFSSYPLGIATLVEEDHAGGKTSLGAADTQFDITNPSGSTFRYTFDGTGTDPLFANYDMVGLSILITGQNFAAGNKNATSAWIITGQGTNYFEISNAGGTAETNKTLGTGAIQITKRVKVTDTKYITVTENIDTYRAGTLYGNSLPVASKTETGIAISSNLDVTVPALKSGDEIWLEDTFSTNARRFAWATNITGGPVKEYDSFRFPGNENNALTMMTNIGDLMLIANAHDMAIWNDYNLQNFDAGIGCTSRYGHVKAAGAIWFVHYTGIYSTNGGIPRLMSSKVQKYIDGATTAGFEAAAAGRNKFSVFFMIGDVTLYHDDGSTDQTLTDVCLEYNIRQESWYVHTGIDAKMFVTYIHSSDPDRIEFLESGGGYDVIELFNTEQDETTTEIPFRIDTDNITLAKKFENIVKIHKIIIELERGSGLECFVSLDNGEFYQIEGEAQKGCNILNVTGRDVEANQPPRCRQVKFSLREYTEKLCKISRVAIIYEETQEEETK